MAQPSLLLPIQVLIGVLVLAPSVLGWTPTNIIRQQSIRNRPQKHWGCALALRTASLYESPLTTSPATQSRRYMTLNSSKQGTNNDSDGTTTNSSTSSSKSYIRNIRTKPSNQLESVDQAGLSDQVDSTTVAAGLVLLVVGAVAFSSSFLDGTVATSPTVALQAVQSFLDNPTETLQSVVDTVSSMGPLGAVYFGIAYTIAEILAIPAIPLTASAGYLFGPIQGTTVVLISASIAASVSFLIGRTLLRDYVEERLTQFPKFQKIDKAIGTEGFKLMLLLRLSPIFPFALSNYLYGASSINFSAFFWGTLFGFAPGTLAYVYTGYIGKALTSSAGDETAYPWYVYVGGLVLFSGIIKLLADTASSIVDELNDDDDDDDDDDYHGDDL